MSKLEVSNDKLQQLEAFDFSSDEKFEITDNYDVVTSYKIARENVLQQESENVIMDLGPKYLDSETIDTFMNKRDNLVNMLRKYAADKPELLELSNSAGGERDKLYAIANYLYNKFISDMSNMKFNIQLSHSEIKFLVNTIKHKLTYDVDNIFQVNKFKEDFLDILISDAEKLSKEDTMVVSINTNNLVLLYHIIAKHTVLGIGEGFYNFIGILSKISEVNQVFNALNIIKERLNTDFNIWAAAITPDETPMQAVVSEEVEVKKKATKKEVKE